MTAPDYMLEDAKWPLHETGHPHMVPPINPVRFRFAPGCTLQPGPLKIANPQAAFDYNRQVQRRSNCNSSLDRNILGSKLFGAEGEP